MDDELVLDDRQDVVDAVLRLGRWLDGHGGDPAEIYDADVVVRSPRGEVRGLDGVLAAVSPSEDSGERTQHRLTDLLVDVAGDRATVQANQLVHFFQAGSAPFRTAGLRVEYGLVRRPAGWRLSEADMHLEWIDGAPVPAPYELVD